MCGLCKCESRYPQSPKEEVRCPEAGVADYCETLLSGCWKPNSGLLQEQIGLLTTDLSL